MGSNSIKNEVLNILIAFDCFCKKNNITYVLGYGTLLGAVRHKGFIPWDDDIDVVLTTDEYQKLRTLAVKNCFLDDNKRYQFAVPGDVNYCYSFMKVIDNKYVLAEKNISSKFNIGLYIDIFRVDYWPESHIIESFQLKYARMLLNLNKICIRGNITDEHFIKKDKYLKPVDIVYQLFGIKTEKIVSRLEKVGLKNKPSKYMGNIMEGSGLKSERLPVEVFKEIVFIEFEKHKFPAPREYDRLLKTIYGDYMKLPPKEKQISHGYNIVEVKDGY